MKKRVIHIFALSLALSSALANAAAPVVDASDVRAIQQQSANQQNQIVAELVLQVNQLQQEVRQLRGLVEEQDYRIKQLTNQQRELYLDIDRRLQGVNTADGLETDSQQESTSESADNVSHDSVTAQSEGQAAYNKAFSQLRDKKYAFAKDSFKSFIVDYPNSELVSNAHYWLGQLHYNDNEFELSEQQFQAVYTKFPNSNKIDAALLKIGQIQEQKGDKKAAKATYQKLAEQFPTTTAGKLLSKLLIG